MSTAVFLLAYEFCSVVTNTLRNNNINCEQHCNAVTFIVAKIALLSKLIGGIAIHIRTRYNDQVKQQRFFGLIL